MKSLRLLSMIPFLFAAACSSRAHLAPPQGFAELAKNDTYSFRATSASGVVIAARTEANDPKGNLDFWTSALDYKLQKSGYHRVGEPEKVASSAGAVGKTIHFEIDRGGRPHEYWVTVFVIDDKVVVVEAAGDKAFFDAGTKKQIAEAVRSVKLG